MVIAIDGPAGAGKSTVAKILAKRLKFLYVDSGAMYRAVTLRAIQKKTDLKNTKNLISIAQRAKINLKENKRGNLKVFLDGKDVSREIRQPQLTQAVFYIANVPQIRKIMVKWQRSFGKANNIVMEGRDIGTVVFPRAEKKFYLDAKVQERAKRRFKELKKKGIAVKFAQIVKEIKERDQKDKTRNFGPLKKAEDAIYVDTTSLNIQQVIKKLLIYV